jgi:hypothetical protein
VDGHAVPMIFLMTTQGLGSGLDTSRRVSKGGDLEDNMVYFDGCHTAVNWVRYMASVYDHRNKNMLEIFKVFIQSKFYEAVGQVMATWKQLGRLGYKGRDKEESVAPHDFSWRVGMMDSAQGPVSAVEEAFAHLKEENRGRVLACKFHVHQCLRKHEVRHLKAEYHAEHKRRVELWINAQTKVVKRSSMNYWSSSRRRAPTSSSVLKCPAGRRFGCRGEECTQCDGNRKKGFRNILVLRTEAFVPTVGRREDCCQTICMCLLQNLEHVLMRTVETVKCYMKDVRVFDHCCCCSRCRQSAPGTAHKRRHVCVFLTRFSVCPGADGRHGEGLFEGPLRS